MMNETNMKTDKALSDEIKKLLDKEGVSRNDTGFILLTETIMCAIKNPCASLNESYAIISKKYACTDRVVLYYIRTAIRNANARREAEGREHIQVRPFVRYCVSYFAG